MNVAAGHQKQLAAGKPDHLSFDLTAFRVDDQAAGADRRYTTRRFQRQAEYPAQFAQRMLGGVKERAADVCGTCRVDRAR